MDDQRVTCFSHCSLGGRATREGFSPLFRALSAICIVMNKAFNLPMDNLYQSEVGSNQGMMDIKIVTITKGPRRSRKA